jgi:hypothetical protein
LRRIWSAGFGTFLQVSALPSHWLVEDCANFKATPEENKTTNTAPNTHSAIKAASQSTLSIHHFSRLVISKNDKNKQLTLLSQRKLASGRNTHFAI